MFSHRLPPSLTPNRFSAALSAARSAGRRLLDLTVSNPTRVGLPYRSGLFRGLADPSAATYRPEPFGLPAAREAAAAELARRGAGVSARHVLLTSSTSETYGTLFKLLCDPGDEVLVPRPSYPLFDHLTALDAVRPVPYDLDHHGGWTIDRSSVEQRTSGRTRTVLVVSPNNPTGSLLRRDDREWLDGFCAGRGLAIISDEVFADYLLRPPAEAVTSILREAGQADRPAPRALTFVLGGLSKAVGLPQLKLAWTAVAGPDRALAEALARLELICDTYLSVGTPVQLSLPRLLEEGAAVRDAIRARLERNLDALEARIADCPACSLLPVEGGWSAVVRVPSVVSEEALILRLLDEQSVVVHPGYFFDFTAGAFLVISLLPEDAEFDEGVDRLCGLLRGLA